MSSEKRPSTAKCSRRWATPIWARQSLTSRCRAETCTSCTVIFHSLQARKGTQQAAGRTCAQSPLCSSTACRHYIRSVPAACLAVIFTWHCASQNIRPSGVMVSCDTR